MDAEVYKDLCQTMAKRGGRYPGMDIPEFYEMAQELFTPEEAAVASAMPRGFNPAGAIAAGTGREEKEVETILEGMADKGLCSTALIKGHRVYGGPPFVPGIFEFQFMRGTKTDRDRRLARLIHAYKTALDTRFGVPSITFPDSRVITVDRMVQAGNKVHTYHQVSAYIDRYDPISVSTCFCRHEAWLIDEKDHCGKPDDVCMQFGPGAQFAIERKMGRQVSKDEARAVLKKSEEAGLVHCTVNQQEIDFLCNCCPCHCMILKTALAQPKPGLALSSGFQPVFDPDLCQACETCIDLCPGTALVMGEEDVPKVDLDRCFGCGVCATACPEEAISLETRPEAIEPPLDRQGLRAAIKAGRGK